MAIGHLLLTPPGNSGGVLPLLASTSGPSYPVEDSTVKLEADDTPAPKPIRSISHQSLGQVRHRNRWPNIETAG